MYYDVHDILYFIVSMQESCWPLLAGSGSLCALTQTTNKTLLSVRRSPMTCTRRPRWSQMERNCVQNWQEILSQSLQISTKYLTVSPEPQISITLTVSSRETIDFLNAHNWIHGLLRRACRLEHSNWSCNLYFDYD